MTPKITDDQRKAVAEHGGMPVYLVDPDTNAGYVLLKAEQFEQVRDRLENEEFNPRDTYSFLDRVMEEDDANDPTLATYQNVPRMRLKSRGLSR